MVCREHLEYQLRMASSTGPIFARNEFLLELCGKDATKRYEPYCLWSVESIWSISCAMATSAGQESQVHYNPAVSMRPKVMNLLSMVCREHLEYQLCNGFIRGPRIAGSLQSSGKHATKSYEPYGLWS